MKEPKFDLDFYNKLADMPDKDLKEWFYSHPEFHLDLKNNFNTLDVDNGGKIRKDPALYSKMEKLGEKLQKIESDG